MAEPQSQPQPQPQPEPAPEDGATPMEMDEQRHNADAHGTGTSLAQEGHGTLPAAAAAAASSSTTHVAATAASPAAGTRAEESPANVHGPDTATKAAPAHASATDVSSGRTSSEPASAWPGVQAADTPHTDVQAVTEIEAVAATSGAAGMADATTAVAGASSPGTKAATCTDAPSSASDHLTASVLSSLPVSSTSIVPTPTSSVRASPPPAPAPAALPSDGQTEDAHSTLTHANAAPSAGREVASGTSAGAIPPAAPVHPSMLAALRMRLEAGRAQQRQMQQQHAHIGSVIEHSFRLLTRPAGRAMPACPCAGGVATLLDTATGKGTAGASKRTVDETPTPTIGSPPIHTRGSLRCSVAGMSIRALQACLSVDTGDRWTISVQMVNTSDHSYEHLQLSLTPAGRGSVLGSLVTHSSSIPRLQASQTACLAIQLHTGSLPMGVQELQLAVGLSWHRSEQATESHVLTHVTLPRWTTHGQRVLLIAADHPLAHVSLPQPLLSVWDVAHRVDVLLQPESAGSIRSAPLAPRPDGWLRHMLTEQFRWSQPVPPASDVSSANALCALSWLRHCRQESSGVGGAVDYLIGDIRHVTPFSRLSACITGPLSLSVYAPSACDLLRFLHALHGCLCTHSLRVVTDTASSEVQLSWRQLYAAMQRENDGQREALQRKFPLLCGPAIKGAPTAAAAATATPAAYMQFQREAMHMQIHTDEAAARAATWI